MALPHRPQRLRRFIRFHELTYAEVAEKLGTNVPRIANLIKGHVYPTPEECDALEALFFPLPAHNFFEESMLEYRYNWPPLRGVALVKAELERAQAQLDTDRHEAGE